MKQSSPVALEQQVTTEAQPVVEPVQEIKQPVYDTSFFYSDSYGTSW
jgi:hypothetical protein